MARTFGVQLKPDTTNYYIRMTSAELGRIITRIDPIVEVKRMVEEKTFKQYVNNLIAAQQARFGGEDWKVSVMTATRTEEIFPLETE